MTTIAATPADAGVQYRASRTWTPAFAGVVALLLAILFAITPADAQNFPKFTGLVVDAANVLPPEVKADLTTKLEALQKDTKRQLVVATIPDMQGYPLDEYGYKLGREWGVGLRDVNNGAVLFIAPNNPAGQRGPRLEVGYGLEPILTDALSSVIINTAMMPRLRAGQVPQAITAGTDAVIAQLRAAPEEQQARVAAAAKEFDAQHKAQRSGSGGFPLGLIFWGMVMLFVVLSLARRAGGGGRRYSGGGSGLGSVVLWNIAANVASAALSSRDGGGGWSGGGSSDSGGGWGDGGFSGGGGGSFGGGGASGDW